MLTSFSILPVLLQSMGSYSSNQYILIKINLLIEKIQILAVLLRVITDEEKSLYKETKCVSAIFGSARI